MKRKTITVLAAIAAGLGYGWLSANKNSNPYYPTPGQHNVPEADMAKAWHWEPSPVWLPSYLLCKVAKHSEANWAGITYTRSGYLFRTTSDLWIYSIASTFIGGVIGLLLACVVRVIMKKPAARINSVEPAHLDES